MFQFSWWLQRFVAIALICGAGLTACTGFRQQPSKIDESAGQAALAADRRMVPLMRRNLADLMAYMRSRPDLFQDTDCNAQRMTSQEERREIRMIWQVFMDHLIALEDLGHQYAAFYDNYDGKDRKLAFHLAYAVFLLEYRCCLDFIDIIQKDKCLAKILNEPEPELGLPENTYNQLKFRYLNVAMGAEFICLDTFYRFYRPHEADLLTPGIQEDTRALYKAGVGKGTVYTLKNAIRMIQKVGFKAWFPIQKGVSQWMGDTKIFRPKSVLIQQARIADLAPQLEPGDIILERREWYLSNLGLPGYWTHAALFVGTPQIRKRYFDDPGIGLGADATHWRGLTFEQLLQKRHPEAYRANLAKHTDGHSPMVIEAVSEGVIFTTLQHTMAADAVAVIRPRLPKAAKARAIEKAFHYWGRPYDFNFDFLTDAALVCTELIYKCYEPAGDMPGLNLPLENMLGRSVLPANGIARIFAREYEKPDAQFSFVCFLDGYEQLKSALPATQAEFRQSWKRPKYHIMLKRNPLETEIIRSDASS